MRCASITDETFANDLVSDPFSGLMMGRRVNQPGTR